MGRIDEFETKVACTLGMLALTVLFCYLPWVVHRKWRKATWLISILNCFAGGVVLGALLMHMIPEIIAPHVVDVVGGETKCETQWGCFAAGVSFLLLFSVDRLFLSHAHCENEETSKGGHSLDAHSHSVQADPVNIPHVHHHHGKECNHDHDHDHDHGHDDHSHSHSHAHTHARHPSSIESEEHGPHEDCHEADIMGGCHMEGIRTSKSQLQTYVFVFCLSLHSLLEGLGISGKTVKNGLANFLFGLFAHKWIEAFALGVTVLSARFSPTKSFFLLGFYAILTPLGIALGMLSDFISASTGTNQKLGRIMNGLSAGSFLFVSCIEMIPPEFHTKNQSTPVKFMAVVVGFLIMVIASLFHSH